jgi:hypothetical protein
MKKLLIILLTTVSFYATALPDSAKQDMYLLGLSDALKEKDYKDALTYIEKLDTLNIEMPNVVNYYRGEALFHTKKYISANTYLTKYIETSGTKGKHYKSALQLLLKVEPIVKEIESRNKKMPKLIKKLVNLINKKVTGSFSGYYKALIGFDENDEIRETRSYKYFLENNVQISLISPTKIELEIVQQHFGSMDKNKNYKLYVKFEDYGLTFKEVVKKHIIDFKKDKIKFKKHTLRCRPSFTKGRKCSNVKVIQINSALIVHNKSQIDKIYDLLQEIVPQ